MGHLPFAPPLLQQACRLEDGPICVFRGDQASSIYILYY